MKDVLNSSKNVLIAIPDKLCIDTASAALGLAYILKAKFNIQIGSVGPIPAEFSQILDFSEFEIINKLKEKEIVLSQNKSKGKIKNVKWRELDEKVQFIVVPEESSFEFSDVDFETSGADFDTIITVGAKTLQSLGNLYLNNPQAFANKQIINIDVNPQNAKFGAHNEIGDKLSLSNWILAIAEREGYEVNQKAAETLFKGVFWANEGFRKNGGLKKALQTFTQKDGELTTTLSQFYNTLSLSELKYIGTMIANVNIDESKVLVSKVRNDEMHNVELEKIVFPEINIISRLKDYKTAIVMSEYESGKTLVKVYSRDESTNVFQVFSEYTPIGNDKRVSFVMEGEIDHLESVLKNKILGNVSQSEDQSQKVEKEVVQDEKASNKGDNQNDSKTGKSQPLTPAKTYPPAQNDNDNNVEKTQDSQNNQPNPAAVYKPPLTPATQNFNANLPSN